MKLKDVDFGCGESPFIHIFPKHNVFMHDVVMGYNRGNLMPGCLCGAAIALGGTPLSREVTSYRHS